MNTATTATANVLGSFDAVEDNIAYGWAFAPQRPQQRLTVELLDERGELVGYGIADHHREDLAPAGVGDGQHLFKLALAYCLYDGKPHTLTAYDASSQTPLNGSHTFGPVTRTFTFDLMSREDGQQWLIEQLRQVPDLTRQHAERLLGAYRLCSVLHETLHIDEAHDAWQTLASAAGCDGLSHCKRAELALLQAQPGSAATHYRHAIQAAPQHLWPHLGLANALQQSGHYNEAERAAADALALAPQHHAAKARLRTLEAFSLNDRVDALLASGHSQAATEFLIKRLLANPTEEQTAERLGALLLPASNNDEALPGQAALLAFKRQERVLSTLLDHVDTQLNESRRP